MKNYKRKKFLTKKGYQLKFTSIIILAMLMVAVVVTFTFYWDAVRILNTEQVKELMHWNRYLVRVILLLAAAFLSGIFLSHKIIGPIHRLEESMKKLNNGEFDLNLILRNNDEFMNLSIEMNELATKLKKIVEKNPNIIDEFKKE